MNVRKGFDVPKRNVRRLRRMQKRPDSTDSQEACLMASLAASPAVCPVACPAVCQAASPVACPVVEKHLPVG